MTEIERLNKTWAEFMEVGFKLQAVSLEVIESKVRERFPNASKIELVVIIDETCPERTIVVFDENDDDLNLDVDWPTENDFEVWWLAASEGAVFGEDGFITIYMGSKT